MLKIIEKLSRLYGFIIIEAQLYNIIFLKNNIYLLLKLFNKPYNNLFTFILNIIFSKTFYFIFYSKIKVKTFNKKTPINFLLYKKSKISIFILLC